MKINLTEITFSNEDIIPYLQKKGFKIETHNTWAGGINDTSWNSNKEYAIPVDEEFDVKKHKKVNDAFAKLIDNGIKKFLMTL